MKFNKTQLATSISLIIGAATIAPLSVSAQETDADPAVEVINVTGIRGSMIKSMDIKRSSTGVVDAITSEDIGKFPDSNLAESLQRITGVSIERNNGEGSKITVRGFGPEFNLVLLNGRQMPTVGGRSFDFGDIATDGVSGVEVHKTASANLPSGGIGATVNMLTARPLNNPGLKASIGVKGVMDTSNEVGDDITPELSGIYSNTFADDKFGILLSGAYQKRNNREEVAAVDNWIPNVDLSASQNLQVEDNNQRADGTTWYPQNLGYGFNDNTRTRTNGQLVMQYAPTDKLTATLDYTYSKVEREAEKRSFGVWFNNGGNVKSATINERGTYTHVEEVSGDYSTNLARSETLNENKSLGLNISWQATEALSFELDAHDSSSEGRGVGLGNDAYVIIGNTSCNFCEDAGPDFGRNTATIDVKTADFNTELPRWDISFLGGDGLPQDGLQPNDMGSLFGGVTKNADTNDMTQYQLKGEWVNLGNGSLAKIDFGYSHTDIDFRSTTAYSGQLAAGWWNWSAIHYTGDEFHKQSLDGLLDQFSGSSNLPVNYFYNADFDQIVDRYETIQDPIDPNGSYNGQWPASLNGKFSAGPLTGDSRVNEVTDSLYTQLIFRDEFNGMPINMVAGIRYEETDTTSNTLETPAVDMLWVGGNEWSYKFAEEKSFTQGAGSYKEFLPNFDFDIELTDDLVARFSYNRSLTRPSIGDLKATTSYDGNPKVGQRKVSIGNPNLKPYIADNIDLSLEYYYGEGSYVSAGYFKKKVDNFLVSTTTKQEMGGLRDAFLGPRAEEARAQLAEEGIPATDPNIFARINENQGADANSPISPNADDPLTVFDVTSKTNQETAFLYGWELASQHMFGESGFGFQANATLVHGNVEADPDSIDQGFYLPGMSNSANFSAIYDKDGLSARLSYNWRDKFLSGTDNHGSPIFTEAYSQLDANINYEVTENLTVFFEGLNLTNETKRVYVRYSDQFLNGSQFGTRYDVGVRYRF